MTVPTLTRLDTCPSCGGCFPGDGPRVCCCGSDWGPPLMAAMADHPDDPPPPDPLTPDPKETA